MRKLKVKSYEEFSARLQVFDTSDLADCLLEAIKRGMKNNNKKVAVCDVEIEEENEVFRLYSSTEDWPTALEGCMNAYLKTEEYEKCSEVKKLLESYEFKKLDTQNNSTEK